MDKNHPEPFQTKDPLTKPPGQKPPRTIEREFVRGFCPGFCTRPTKNGGGPRCVTYFFWGVPGCVTKCDRGRGVKIGQIAWRTLWTASACLTDSGSDPLLYFVLDKRLWISWFSRLSLCGRGRKSRVYDYDYDYRIRKLRRRNDLYTLMVRTYAITDSQCIRLIGWLIRNAVSFLLLCLYYS